MRQVQRWGCSFAALSACKELMKVKCVQNRSYGKEGLILVARRTFSRNARTDHGGTTDVPVRLRFRSYGSQSSWQDRTRDDGDGASKYTFFARRLPVAEQKIHCEISASYSSAQPDSWGAHQPFGGRSSVVPYRRPTRGAL